MYIGLNEAEKKKEKREKTKLTFYMKNFLKSLVNDNKTLSNLLSTAYTPIFVFNLTPGIKSFDKCDSIILIELSVKFISAPRINISRFIDHRIVQS